MGKLEKTSTPHCADEEAGTSNGELEVQPVPSAREAADTLHTPAQRVPLPMVGWLVYKDDGEEEEEAGELGVQRPRSGAGEAESLGPPARAWNARPPPGTSFRPQARSLQPARLGDFVCQPLQTWRLCRGDSQGKTVGRALHTDPAGACGLARDSEPEVRARCSLRNTPSRGMSPHRDGPPPGRLRAPPHPRRPQTHRSWLLLLAGAPLWPPAAAPREGEGLALGEDTVSPGEQAGGGERAADRCLLRRRRAGKGNGRPPPPPPKGPRLKPFSPGEGRPRDQEVGAGRAGGSEGGQGGGGGARAKPGGEAPGTRRVRRSARTGGAGENEGRRRTGTLAPRGAETREAPLRRGAPLTFHIPSPRKQSSSAHGLPHIPSPLPPVPPFPPAEVPLATRGPHPQCPTAPILGESSPSCLPLLVIPPRRDLADGSLPRDGGPDQLCPGAGPGLPSPAEPRGPLGSAVAPSQPAQPEGGGRGGAGPAGPWGRGAAPSSPGAGAGLSPEPRSSRARGAAADTAGASEVLDGGRSPSALLAGQLEEPAPRRRGRGLGWGSRGRPGDCVGSRRRRPVGSVPRACPASRLRLGIPVARLAHPPALPALRLPRGGRAPPQEAPSARGAEQGAARAAGGREGRVSRGPASPRSAFLLPAPDRLPSGARGAAGLRPLAAWGAGDSGVWGGKGAGTPPLAKVRAASSRPVPSPARAGQRPALHPQAALGGRPSPTLLAGSQAVRSQGERPVLPRAQPGRRPHGPQPRLVLQDLQLVGRTRLGVGGACARARLGGGPQTTPAGLSEDSPGYTSFPSGPAPPSLPPSSSGHITR
ncbi:collagen alpha-1(I) chain-like [Sarcophilus harrisii]|uniref:collagen alpha-1(I) chain-like n=1 Tax=Sarcophilus harrisii TaxID=9305 RepID=UPI001301FC20|nr:collagen alpha-1(I) chain-like [Sarcophilus harrisii]